MRRHPRAIALASMIFTGTGGCSAILGLEEPDFGGDAGTIDASEGAVGFDGGSESGTNDVTSNPDAVSDATADATIPIAGILDDFDRPNSLAVGNGWIEKTAAVFDLVNNAAELVVGNVDFRDTLVYRGPGGELDDVTVGVTFRSDTNLGSQFVVARLQSAATPQAFFGYYAACPDTTRLQIVRQNGATSTVLADIMLNTQLVVKTSYRLTLKVANVGGTTVLSNAQVRTLDGTIVGQVANSDGTAARITTAGSVGFGGTNNLGARTRFDDYSRTSP